MKTTNIATTISGSTISGSTINGGTLNIGGITMSSSYASGGSGSIRLNGSWNDASLTLDTSRTELRCLGGIYLYGAYGGTTIDNGLKVDYIYLDGSLVRTRDVGGFACLTLN